MIIFHKTFLIKQKKNNWARNYMRNSHRFVQFEYKPLLQPPRNLGKRTQTANFNDHFLVFLAVLVFLQSFWVG